MILYHGCAAPFDRFDPDLLGRGYEANSALGAWTTRDPHLAADYGLRRCVMSFHVPRPRLAAATDFRTVMYGGPDLWDTDFEIGRPVFEEMRATLMAEGYDGVWCELPGTELEGAVCILDPARLERVAVLTGIDDAKLEDLEDPKDDCEVDFHRDVGVFATSSSVTQPDM